MNVINPRARDFFRDRDEPGLALRSFTADEAEYVCACIEACAQRNQENHGAFSVRQLIATLNSPPTGILFERYRRPLVELLHRYVGAGLLAEVTQQPLYGVAPVEDREFRAVASYSLDEFALGTAVQLLGVPYIAEAYAGQVVRVHAGLTEVDPIGSGVVIIDGWVLTNRHVIESASSIGVSWGPSGIVEARSFKLSSDPTLDLAVIEVPEAKRWVTTWFRAPRAADSIIVMGYPYIPQVCDRPLLRFTGVVSSGSSVLVRSVGERMLITAVMLPGCSGGPIFSSDGYFVGLVSEEVSLSTEQAPSVIHVGIPADRILPEIRGLYPPLAHVSKWV